MAKEFRLPDLGSGLKEGEIVSWLVKVGDEVTDEDLLCEVETEKAVIEVPVPFNGTVLSLAAEVGESVKVGAVLAVFGEAGELSGAPDEAAPETAVTQAGTPEDVAGKSAAVATAATSPSAAPVADDLLRAMPAVRRLAAEHEIDISQIDGSGRDGRVTKKDVLAFMKQGATEQRRWPRKRRKRLCSPGPEKEFVSVNCARRLQTGWPSRGARFRIFSHVSKLMPADCWPRGALFPTFTTARSRSKPC